MARYGEVELIDAAKIPSGAPVSDPARTNRGPQRAGSETGAPLKGHRGNVNAVVFSADGAQLFAAAGEPGLFGEVRQWNVAEGKLMRVLEGHRDAIYSVALSLDGRVLATGSYDQKIKLWDVATGRELNTLHGHNGAVFGLAFRPDGKILASASADRTVKLWHVAAGQRTDTLSQPLKDQYTVVFSADGQRLFAAGADSRIRVWQISATAVETTNPLLDAHFAHEGTILRLALSPDGRRLLSCADDRSVKLWDAAELKQQRAFGQQRDWASAAAFLANDRIAVGRLDGSLDFYDLNTGQALAAPTLKAEMK